jgi:hypothetical protein
MCIGLIWQFQNYLEGFLIISRHTRTDETSANARQRSSSHNTISARVLARVLKFQAYVLPSVFECSRVL